MGRIALAALTTLLLLPLLIATPAMADDVDVALVLVTDVSRSIDDSEFALEKNGYASAFVSQKVLEAIQGGPTGRIAVAYVEFASSFEVRTVLDWTVIRDKASAQAFADRLTAAPRSFWGRTAISAGVDQAVQLLAEIRDDRRPPRDRRLWGRHQQCRPRSGRCSGRRGEGWDHDQRISYNQRPPRVLDLPHVQPPGGLANYYRENVTGGPGSFVLEVHDFASFGEAMTRKLVDEIASGLAKSKFALELGLPGTMRTGD